MYWISLGRGLEPTQMPPKEQSCLRTGVHSVLSLIPPIDDDNTFRSPQLQTVIEEAIDFFNKTPLNPLPPSSRFLGPGVYALYYLGKFDLYTPLATANQEECKWPIYVGKAVPPGWRTGRATSSPSSVLYSRLREHFHSIDQTKNLKPDDFHCRYMLLKDAETDLIGTIEAALIRTYQPIWNTTIDGFGNHDPGSGRYEQSPSEWDTLHPGRVWAARLKGTAPQLDGIRREAREELQRIFRSSTTAS